MSPKPTLFLLGATGFLGSQFLTYLARDLPNLHIVALVRAPTGDKEAKLKAVYDDLSVVEGTLDDDAVIQEQAANADYTINCASSDHLASVVSSLAGLEKASASRPGKPPLYIHVSGLGITSDNCRGEHVELADIPHYTDIDLDLEKCPPTNMHLDSDKLIVAAGTRTENPVRTIIVFPGWIYGVGDGIQKTTLPIRIFLNMFKSAGFAGTWGPGLNRMGNIHVRDCANAVMTVFKAALEGKAEEGAEGFYFAVSDEPRVTNVKIVSTMGDIMFSKGLIGKGGSQPMPSEIVDPLGHYGWSLMGGNQIVTSHRLRRLGWEPVETKKKSLMESLPEELELAIILGL
ncbi:hypothetical protein Hypma_004030 [Hypsizygus marmoreus]|uniref:NAD-dependent epimerase/dehydratase domain-containing protein n=1 Tax=Hypsizygus marmoreus TaxID=39966 RepID=A0A369J0V7_HYPMA|nr:hypothetical protein Hypma_004030 [Hypsizygus marmoreus]